MSRVLKNHQLGRIFVISAPSGTGKTTLARLLIQEFPHDLGVSCSCTTRPPRQGEVDGEHYHFLSEEEFASYRQEGAFLEEVHLFGYSYGTLEQEVAALHVAGKHVILTLDTQGLRQVKKRFDQVVSIFMSPPSEQIQLERMLQRQTEQEETVRLRLAYTKCELSCRSEYDYQFVNQDLMDSYQILKSIVIAEEYRRKDVP